jgi:hypothetical protein
MSAVGGEGVAIEHAREAVNWSGCDPKQKSSGASYRSFWIGGNTDIHAVGRLVTQFS